MFQKHDDLINSLQELEIRTKTGQEPDGSASDQAQLGAIGRVPPEDHIERLARLLWSLEPNNPPVGTQEDEARALYNRLILESLSFPSMDQRGDDIPAAYMDTYDWALKEPPVNEEGKSAWASLPAWLEEDSDQPYWITGKPGSGKSTLMKFISDHPNLRARLHKWAQPRELLFGTFYFWIGGDTMQKSHEGLLRSLLRQLLSQKTALISRACRRRWALLRVFHTEAIMPDWTWPELLEAFSTLRDGAEQQFNIALFIDGLDEFDGPHERLIKFIDDLRGLPGVKLCVSSRPWNVFQDAFDSSPSLRMEGLTASDIQTYVKGQFDDTPAFRELCEALPDHAATLIDDIVAKAQGVFLWVHVVVRTLRQGLTEGSRISDLQDLVKRLPPEMDRLYHAMSKMVNPVFHQHRSHLLQIHRAMDEPWRENREMSDIETYTNHAVIMWLADEEDALGKHVVTFEGPRRIHLIIRTMQRRLNSRTMGLLEVHEDGHITYLHRTSRDWVQSQWTQICAEGDPGFDPVLSVLRASVASIKAHPSDNPRQYKLAVERCMREAGSVRESDASVSSMIMALDCLQDELVMKEWSHVRGRNPYDSVRRSLGALYSSQVKTDMLYVAAQYGVFAYVRHRLLTRRNETPSGGFSYELLFRCAIYGAGFFDTDLKIDYTISDQRRELASFLLTHWAARIKTEPSLKMGPASLVSGKDAVLKEISDIASHTPEVYKEYKLFLYRVKGEYKEKMAEQVYPFRKAVRVARKLFAS
jgi:hypothetical protein